MKSKGNIRALRNAATLALVLVGGLMGTACDSGNPATSPTAVTRATAGATTAPTKNTGASGTSTPQGSAANGKLDCQAIVNAAFDLNGSEPFLVMMSSGGGSVVNRVDSPFYIDTAKIRGDLNVLASLADPTDPTEISIMGKPSESIPQFRQLLDIVDRDASRPPDSTPVSGSADEQQRQDISLKLVRMSTSISYAVGNSCPNTTANVVQGQPGTSQATPLAASYGLGQTATVGDLRVTLDKIVSSPGANANLPEPGNRFVFVYFTVQNTGKNLFQVNTLSGTHWEAAGGKKYYFDPHTIMLDPNTTNFDGGIQPGAKQSGAIGYQLPASADGLVWVFEDFKPNRAVFTVKASDIGSVGAPVTEPTEDAMRAQAAATQTAFIEMVGSMEATQEVMGTEAPDLPEPTEIPVP